MAPGDWFRSKRPLILFGLGILAFFGGLGMLVLTVPETTVNWAGWGLMALGLAMVVVPVIIEFINIRREGKGGFRKFTLGISLPMGGGNSWFNTFFKILVIVMASVALLMPFVAVFLPATDRINDVPLLVDLGVSRDQVVGAMIKWFIPTNQIFTESINITLQNQPYHIVALTFWNV
ncbi:MAG TPA: hypothetical protein ENN60_01610, partial [archaeon]|nr:hypothetical protein [archaeon]